jgi:polyhydroxybutyrate depolymerase
VIRARRPRVAPLAWAVIAAVACTVTAVMPSASAIDQASSGCARLPGSLRFNAGVEVDGQKRTALVNVPPARRRGVALPVVLMFHGANGNGRGMESTTGMTTLGNSNGFITVYPNSNGKYWNVTGRNPSAPDDTRFVDSLLDQLTDRLCIDDTRIYASGLSNGGSFVARIGCELSERLAAIAPVAGGYGVQPQCRPARPVSVLEIHGTKDRTVPYDGDGPNGEIGVWPFIAQWDTWNACPQTPPKWQRLGPRALLAAKTGCAGGTTVAHVKLIGEPHTWPTTQALTRPHIGALFSARQAIWQFFATRAPSTGGQSLVSRGS